MSDRFASPMSSPTTLHDPRERAVAQRFEAKYLLTDLQAEMIREYVAPYTVADTHLPVYPVTSLYLDSPALTTYVSSLHGEKNRYKLRIRGYESEDAKPLYCEVKQRVGRVIRKHRACVRRDGVENMNWQGVHFGDDLLAEPGDTRACENLGLFSELCGRLGAGPKLGVRYMREAYVSALGEPVRVTLDRDISYTPVPERPIDLWNASTPWRLLDELPTVLEIKFTDAFPFWVGQMVQRFELTRVSLAKYVVCIKAADREGVYLSRSDRSTN